MGRGVGIKYKGIKEGAHRKKEVQPYLKVFFISWHLWEGEVLHGGTWHFPDGPTL